MIQLSFANLSLSDLEPLVNMRKLGIAEYDWTQVDAVTLSVSEQQDVDKIQARLLKSATLLMNETTIWGRAIYPLLMLAEQGDIHALAEVPLQAQFKTFEISGVADSVFGREIEGRIETPYLVVLETKRGIEAKNPQHQLYGQLLAAAWLNWKENSRATQEIWGCYTVADVWTFNRAEITGFEAARPSMVIETSREYSEKLEAVMILKILKQILKQILKRYGVRDRIAA
ncbi:MAG: hypothetical protein AAF152_20430 [Cyanobacteria bacterium P01_A01_bin.114]